MCRVAHEPDARIATSRAQPQLTPRRHCAQHAPACSDCFDRSLPGTVSAVRTSRMHALHPATNAFDCFTPHRQHTWRLVEHALLTAGAFEKAPQRGADTGKGHALSFSLHPRAFTSKQRLIKKKSMRTCLSVVLFYLLPLVPLRIEAVIKILTIEWRFFMLQLWVTLPKSFLFCVLCFPQLATYVRLSANFLFPQNNCSLFNHLFCPRLMHHVAVGLKHGNGSTLLDNIQPYVSAF